nr:hypothetical protein [Streptomyces indicus]
MVRAVAVALLLTGVTAGCTDRPTTHHKPGTSHKEASGSTGRLLDTKDEDGNRYREVAAEGAPSVEEFAARPGDDGWELALTVRNFRFTPDSVGGAALPGRGYARLYVDGKPAGRVYGKHHHIPEIFVPDRSHRLTVRLYADDHTVWAVGGAPVEQTITVSHPDGQSTPPDDAPDVSPDKPSKPAEPAVDRTLKITIDGKQVDPAPGRIEVKKGDRIRLTVTSDRADTLHVHGYDKEADLAAGRPASLTFTADRTGLFEVETHGSGLLLTQLVVR